MFNNKTYNPVVDNADKTYTVAAQFTAFCTLNRYCYSYYEHFERLTVKIVKIVICVYITLIYGDLNGRH